MWEIEIGSPIWLGQIGSLALVLTIRGQVKSMFRLSFESVSPTDHGPSLTEMRYVAYLAFACPGQGVKILPVTSLFEQQDRELIQRVSTEPVRNAIPDDSKTVKALKWIGVSCDFDRALSHGLTDTCRPAGHSFGCKDWCDPNL